MCKIEIGSRVTLHLILSLLDGTEVENTHHEGEPLSFVVGDGTLIDNLEAVMLGMAAGEQRLVRLSPENAFGYSDSDNIHEMPRAQFDAQLELSPGVVMEFSLPSGEQVPGTIIELRDDSVMVDFSHPLANREILFDVEVLEVQPPANVV